MRIFILAVIFLISITNLKADNFSDRKNFNKMLKGFYNNQIFKCKYVQKSWSTGFDIHPYGMVNNSGAFKNILVFKHKNIIGTLWPNIGEITLTRGVRKYQLWKSKGNDEYEMIDSPYHSDEQSDDVNFNENTYSDYKTYFDDKTLKISVQSWLTDFYGCKEIESSNFARRKLIDIFVNQNEYVRKDFAYREKNPSLFTNKIDLLPD
tara:strand:+ start:1053 stop:1673 length:621 start_codon:yes stop_codon:yes gene_type:complete